MALKRISAVRKHFMYRTSKRVTQILDVLVPLIKRKPTHGNPNGNGMDPGSMLPPEILSKLLRKLNIMETEVAREHRDTLEQRMASLQSLTRCVHRIVLQH